MNTWSKEINLDDYAECKEFRIHYYTRRMNGGYNSHLFLVNWDSEEQLLKGWNQIDSFVAVNIQSQTELLIERSNFYIIHFVKKTVMKEIKREIEYNPFCAKKYVYDNFQEDLYVERNYVEEKIFHLAVSEVTEYENKKMRVKKIKLKNFRGYKGCVEFNLVDQDKKPASFVVIYAPNGVGKTSLFDGVEYALKGEVSYLKNTEKISKFKGPIYHNREKAYEEAYASIFLDNGEEIHRKVHTLKENGTDTDVVAASGKKAKDIVGLKKDNNKWDNILLPHAKIDSFISASKPEERYIEWFNSTPELNEERKYFERIGKDISVIDKSLIEIKKEIARLENERKKLEKSESNFKNIQKLISAFNKRSEMILPNITSLSTETEYDELLNEVKKIIRDYNRQLNILKDHLILYNELNTMGFKEYKKRLNTIKSLKERISKISSLIENKKKLEKLEREYTNTKENHLKVMETLYPYNSILEVGKENIINLARKYKNAEEEIKKLNNMHFSVQKEIEKLNEEKQLREKNISKFKAILETEELGVNKFNELQETRSSIQIGKETFDVKKEYIKDINEKIFKLEKRLDLLEKKNVPFTIDEWTVSKISEWRELLKPIIIEQIDSLRMDYRLLENSILAEKESISKMWNAERRSEKLQIEKENKIVELDKIQKNLEKELSLYFSKSTMNEIYQKIDPHDVMKRLEYHLSFNDAQKGELFITLSESESDSDSDYRPEIYFSTAQLNTVAFSSFFSRALDRKNNLPIQTIFIDDPIGHFDDMNILGFADLMRSLIDNSNWQIVISTHDEKIFRILQRKLSGEYYSSCFLKLPSGKGIKWIE